MILTQLELRSILSGMIISRGFLLHHCLQICNENGVLLGSGTGNMLSSIYPSIMKVEKGSVGVCSFANLTGSFSNVRTPGELIGCAVAHDLIGCHR